MIEIEAYKTLDGRIFDNFEDARKHEASLIKDIRGWDRNHKPTIDTNEINLVHLPTADSLHYFILLCDEENTITAGIDEDVTGWYIWDDERESFFYVPVACAAVIVNENKQQQQQQ